GVVVEVGWLASAKSACNSRKNVSKVSNGSSLTLDTPSPSSEGTLEAVGAPTKALSSIAENSTDCAALFSWKIKLFYDNKFLTNFKSTILPSLSGHHSNSSSMKGMFDDSSLGTRLEVSEKVCDIGTGIETRAGRRGLFSHPRAC
ncbi:GSCOCG00000765001-RA-CDS, partial [Cotesia congregata]